MNRNKIKVTTFAALALVFVSILTMQPHHAIPEAINAYLGTSDPVGNVFSNPMVMEVIRTSPDPSLLATYSYVDNQTIEKYPSLDDAIKQADDLYAKIKLACPTGACPAVTIPSLPTEQYKLFPITSDEANMIMNDSKFNFTRDNTGAYRCHLHLGDAIYNITMVPA